MKVPYDEGLAIHIGLESCVYVRKGMGEALTKEMRARLSSHEIKVSTVCRRSKRKRKATPALAIKRASTGHCEV